MLLIMKNQEDSNMTYCFLGGHQVVPCIMLEVSNLATDIVLGLASLVYITQHYKS